jgi:uncharacterized membrane protein YcaP (DUF421 family)
MKKEEIYFSDWQRILLGNVPLEFLLEVVLRTLLIYVALVVVMRLLGKRMNAQLTITELAVMITLGGIVAVPMQLPERGILVGVVILVVILAVHRGLNWFAFKYRPVELVVQGDVCLLVKDGCLDLEELGHSRLSREQLFANLRTQNIQHLGQVKRAYFEGCGMFSVFREKTPKPGLSILPETDAAILQAEPHQDGAKACAWCGHVEAEGRSRQEACPNCGRSKWTYAVNEKEKNYAYQER